MFNTLWVYFLPFHTNSFNTYTHYMICFLCKLWNGILASWNCILVTCFYCKPGAFHNPLPPGLLFSCMWVCWEPSLRKLLLFLSGPPQHSQSFPPWVLFSPTSESLEFLKDLSLAVSSLLHTSFFIEFYVLRVLPLSWQWKYYIYTCDLSFNLYLTSLFPNH